MICRLLGFSDQQNNLTKNENYLQLLLGRPPSAVAKRISFLECVQQFPALEGNFSKGVNNLISVGAVHWLKIGSGESGTQQALQAAFRVHGFSIRSWVLENCKDLYNHVIPFWPLQDLFF